MRLSQRMTSGSASTAEEACIKVSSGAVDDSAEAAATTEDAEYARPTMAGRMEPDKMASSMDSREGKKRGFGWVKLVQAMVLFLEKTGMVVESSGWLLRPK